MTYSFLAYATSLDRDGDQIRVAPIGAASADQGVVVLGHAGVYNHDAHVTRDDAQKIVDTLTAAIAEWDEAEAAKAEAAKPPVGAIVLVDDKPGTNPKAFSYRGWVETGFHAQAVRVIENDDEGNDFPFPNTVKVQLLTDARETQYIHSDYLTVIGPATETDVAE